MKKKNIKIIIPYILIISGGIIISIALYLKVSTTYYQNMLVEEYFKNVMPPVQVTLGESTVIVKENETGAEDFDKTEQLEENRESEESENPKEPKENPVVKYLQGKKLSGVIEIPKLGIKAAILEGTDDRALKYTVGHYPGTANPGEKGNYVLLGHRNYVYGHYFRRIDELNPGDEVIIKKDKETYIYLITESFVVSPEDVWVLEDTEETEETMLTMITCTPIITYTDRLIVRGVISEK